jgi:hypothetical protein
MLGKYQFRKQLRRCCSELKITGHQSILCESIFFRVELGKDPLARVTPMVIELINETTVDSHRVPARTFAPLQQRFLKEHVEFLLRTGVVQVSQSNVTSPIVLVRKQDRSWRMYIDLRWVNSKTKTMRCRYRNCKKYCRTWKGQNSSLL